METEEIVILLKDLATPDPMEGTEFYKEDHIGWIAAKRLELQQRQLKLLAEQISELAKRSVSVKERNRG